MKEENILCEMNKVSKLGHVGHESTVVCVKCCKHHEDSFTIQTPKELSTAPALARDGGLHSGFFFPQAKEM